MTKVTYGLSVDAWLVTKDIIENLIKTNALKKICEVGAGANPLFSVDHILANNLDYTVMDISQEELKKSPPGYKGIVMDICQKDSLVKEKFDLVFSRMLAEHLADGELFHRNVYNLLNEGGFAFHFFPTLYALPFVINKLMPIAISSLLLDIFAPRDRVKLIKLPAYYNWCRGPLRQQIRRFETLNYDVLEYGGFFGVEEYYKKIPPVRYAATKVTNFLVRHPSPYLTAYAYVLLKKAQKG